MAIYSLIYLLKMMTFHSFLYVYQRVTHNDGENPGESSSMRPAEILAAEDTPQGGSSHWCCSYLKEMAGTPGNQRTPSSIKHIDKKRQWCCCR